ncbi:YutD family protein [Limosilactobacillus secaliphilus]|uniref:Transcriptional regulator n=1 Tax=Limosilactobacillus secaliphilus TaxID=396268 RepID=A0A0R2IBI7_9LACO|nr:YutD family protein [Limosilactobacillus secaliphilus]KRN59370.1 hypothetical protein IV45_GL001113 [Limosilactobacillus secaliphilus]
MNRSEIQNNIDQRTEERKGVYHVTMQDEEHFLVNRHHYQLVDNYRNAFDPEKLADRFSSILAKFDYIVGDWGYDQLRLRGFYDESNPLYQADRGVDTIQEYIDEECNFGCAYFVIQNLDVHVPKNAHKNNRRHKSSRGRRRHHPFHERREKLSQPPVKQRHGQEVTSVSHGHKRNFVLRKKRTTKTKDES